MAGPKKPKMSRLPAVQFEDFAEADRVFRESVTSLNFGPLPDLNRGDDGPQPHRSQSKKRPKPSLQQIDLHGLTLQQAKDHLDRQLKPILQQLTTQISLRIITGKGLHSGPGGSILAREIHRHVEAVYGLMIVAIDDSPADLVLGGLPLRGYFNVTFGR